MTKVFFTCKECRWTQERDSLPARCPRCCTARVLQSITKDAFLTLLSIGKVRFCHSCNYVHTA